MRKKNVELKKAIFETGKTQREVSRKTGIPESQISMAINGKYVFDRIEQARIAEVLNRPQDVLFSDGNT